MPLFRPHRGHLAAQVSPSGAPVPVRGNNNKKMLMPGRHQSRAYSFGISYIFFRYLSWYNPNISPFHPDLSLCTDFPSDFSCGEGVCTQATATLASGSYHWQPRQNGGRKINSNFVNYKIIKFSSLKCMRHPVVRLPPSLARCSN